MKKSVITLLCCLFALFAQAQTEHMKFMGIPINGTINQFQAKLVAKGLNYNDEVSRQLQNGIFSGHFAGERSEIRVNYNQKSGIVYMVTVAIERYKLEQAKDLFEDFKYRLKQKYNNSETEEDKLEGYPEFRLACNDKEGNVIGAILLSISEDNGKYYLIIDYYDSANYMANEQSIDEDL